MNFTEGVKVQNKITRVSGTVKKIIGGVMLIKRDPKFITNPLKSKRCLCDSWVTSKPENWEVFEGDAELWQA